MGIFRNDPQPVQLTPHVPAAALTTGSQPPRVASQLAMAMAVVSMAWPQPGEPHPIQPMQGRSQIAPLTLVYGQQPPRIDPMPKVQAQVVRVSWPEDREPRLQFNNQQPDRRYVAPLTLVYGSQPPIAGPLSTLETNLAVRSWDPPRPEPPPLVKVAPLTLVYGDQPAVVGAISATEMASFVESWKPPRPEPPPLVKIVPLTLVYGDQPPSDAKRVARHVAWRAWDAPAVQPQQMIGSAAWNVPPIVTTVPFTALPGSILGAWQIDWRAQSAKGIVSTTLVYGQQPPARGALIVPQITAILAPAPTWGAQSEPDNAHWNVPLVIAQVPFFRSPVPYTAIEWSAQRGSQIAPLTLIYGQKPPSAGPLSAAQRVIALWQPEYRAPEIRHWIAPLAGILVETNALTGTIRVQPILTGQIQVVVSLDGEVLTTVDLQGLVSTQAQLQGWIQVTPVLLGKIIVRPS